MANAKYRNPEYARDLAGQTFGNLTAVRRAESRQRAPKKEAVRSWICRCICSNEVEVQASDLIRGRKKSCGCKAHAPLHTACYKHGGSYTREYQAWISMIRRCTYKKNIRYHCYGGRGIKVCDRWMDFGNFYADMGVRPSADHSLDRHPNKDGDYEPGNCRWATRVEQARNKRNNIVATIGGQTQSAPAWEEEYGLPEGLVRRRIGAGITGEALLAPVARRTDNRAPRRKQFS